MNKESKIWYCFLGGNFKEHDLGFIDTEAYSWISMLEQNTQVIKNEVDSFIALHNNEIKPYFNQTLVTKPHSWKTFSFFFWKWKMKKNMRKCPETIKVLDNIPHIVSASISILEPGVTIKPHRGDTNAIVRFHLPLFVPEGLPNCGFEVAGTKKAWQEGKVLAFNDSAVHTAWNLTDKKRYVLLIDVMRLEFVNKKLHVCTMILSVLLMQALIQKLPFINKMPNFLKYIPFAMFYVIVYTVLIIRNTLKV